MKSVLFVAQDSFPMHGAESIVNLKLLAALSQSGEFVIDLISKKAKGESYKANSLDELGISVRNLYVLGVDNRITVSSIWQHFRCFLKFGIVFKGSHWASLALDKALLLYNKNKYDYILTKNQASVLVGYYLKKKYGLKWIATWNDPFPSSLYPPIYKNFFHEKDNWAYQRIIKVTRNYVDKVIVPSERLKNYMLPFYQIESTKVVVIPHVVNNINKREEGGNRNGNTLRLIHSGNISYPRDPNTLLEGLKILLHRHSDYRIQLDILGMADASLQEKIRLYDLDKYVKIIPPVSYIDSLRLLDDYDAAVVVEAVLDEGIFLPTKVSDFMQCGKAIFAISPAKGVLNDLYVNGNIGYFADNRDSSSVYEMMDELYRDFLSHSVKKCKIPVGYTEKYVVDKYLGF
jgi:glycosyltransferase involved in cell wall biosynthesis